MAEFIAELQSMKVNGHGKTVGHIFRVVRVADDRWTLTYKDGKREVAGEGDARAIFTRVWGGW